MNIHNPDGVASCAGMPTEYYDRLIRPRRHTQDATPSGFPFSYHKKPGVALRATHGLVDGIPLGFHSSLMNFHSQNPVPPYPFASSFAKESFKAMVRLKTGAPGFESLASATK